MNGVKVAMLLRLLFKICILATMNGVSNMDVFLFSYLIGVPLTTIYLGYKTNAVATKKSIFGVVFFEMLFIHTFSLIIDVPVFSILLNGLYDKEVLDSYRKWQLEEEAKWNLRKYEKAIERINAKKPVKDEKTD